jgi:hypothetical protein
VAALLRRLRARLVWSAGWACTAIQTITGKWDGVKPKDVISQYAAMRKIEHERHERLMIAITYEGPWERLARFAFGLDRHGNLRWDVWEGSPMWRFASWLDARDYDWRNRHVSRKLRPRRIWRRRRDHSYIPPVG